MQECGIPEVYADFNKTAGEPWPVFVGRMLTANKVILACDSAYVRHTIDAPDNQGEVDGHGAHTEWLQIQNRLYEDLNKGDWLVPLLMEGGARNDVPAQLRAWQYEQLDTSTWNVDDDEKFQKFWQRLHNTQRYQLPPASAQRMPVRPPRVLSSNCPRGGARHLRGNSAC